MTLPVLIKASPTMTSVAEGALNPAGMTVAALAVDETFIDENGRPSVEAIAIEAVNTSLGTWQYSLNGGADWLTVRADLINSSTNKLALLLGPTDMIRLLPFGDLNGSMADAITFRSWNMETGSAGNYVVTTPGVDFFSFDSDTASITVTPVNDAPTFAPVQGTGKAIIPVGSSDDQGQSVTVQPDGKIIAAGYSLNGGNWDFSLVRLNADGSLDGTFGGSPAPGQAIIPVGSSNDQGYSVTVQPDGKIIVAGISSNGSDNDFGLVRLNADGSLDSTFGGSPAPGKAIIPVGSSTDEGYSVTVQPDGKIIVAGISSNGSFYDFSLVRLNADGSLDTTFGPTPDGKAIIPVGSSGGKGYGVTVQPDGKIIVAGYSHNGSNSDFSLVRLNADGSLDSTFGGSPAPGKAIIPVGSSDDVGRSVTVKPDGKIIVAGYSVNGSTNDFSLVRLNADGSLDSTFGGSPAPGKAIIPVGSSNDVGFSVAVQPDGKIIVAGYSHNGSNFDFSLVRLNADGSLDSTFGGSPAPGTAIIPVGSDHDFGHSVTVQPDGKIIVAGFSSNGSTDDFSLVRLNADGSLDLSFNGAPVNTLGGTVAYTEGAAAIALDASVAIQDVDLAALASGAGNYASASVSLARGGGANSEDIFSALDNLSFAAGDAILSGVTVGSVTNTGGTLTITFNGDATQARVNEVLSSIGYANSSDAPPASVVIDYVFSDGNTSDVQGPGGALMASGSVTVNITSADDTPTLNQAIADQQASEDTYFSFQFAAGTFVDPDGDTLSYSATLAGGGALPAWLTFDGATRTFSGTPGDGDVGTLSVTVTASDGDGPTASDTFDIAVASTNDAPTGGATISGIPGLGHLLTAVTTTLADADGLGPLHYTWLRNGVAIAGAADAATYKAGLADFGATLSVRVSYVDLGGTAESVISPPTALIALAGPPPGMNPVIGGGVLNILKGTAGGDWFNGGWGIDWMTGGAGDDIYFVNSILDFVVEAPGGGTDLVISSALAWILPANVENLLLNGPLALIGTGNGLNNVIVGNTAANQLYGLDGADTLKGLGGADQLEGGNGDDVLAGGLGRDTLTGGAGRDTLVFDVAPGTANADTIRGFNASDDTIQLVRGAGFEALNVGTLAASAFVIGRYALGAEDRIMYDRASGNLYYDADGTGAIGSVQIATLVGSPELTYADIVVV